MKSKSLIYGGIFGTLTLVLILAITEVRGLSQSVLDRFERNKFQPPLEFYASSFQVTSGEPLSKDRLQEELLFRNYRLRSETDTLQQKDFHQVPANLCPKIKQAKTEGSGFFFLRSRRDSVEVTGEECLQFRPSSPGGQIQIRSAVWDEEGRVHLFENGHPFHGTWPLEPELFAQFYGEAPILRRKVTLGEVPMMCLDTLLAIEDSDFLKHQGFSARAIARAFWTNVRSGRISQGGSTITQQLVKNYFLTPEKTLRRKFRELILSILLEWHLSKEEILETYLNVIYMGQNGAYQVRGYGAASDHYFNKPIGQLQLSECALLAALVNSPGRFDPQKNPERALERRSRVLERSVELELISSEQAEEAKEQPLPRAQRRAQRDPAPYFVQSVISQLRALGFPLEEGLKVYTTLDFQHQTQAQKTLQEGLKNLDQRFTKEGQSPLQGAVLSVHIPTGAVLSLQGGRSYVRSQFNRVVDSKRLVGSTSKPFVYLTALEEEFFNGNEEPFGPFTMLQDEPFEWRYDRQSWKPENYSRTFRGPVPAVEALALSLNVPTVQLGQAVGLKALEEIFHEVGLLQKGQAILPSHILGSMQLSPWGLAQAYLPLARRGLQTQLHSFVRVEDLAGEVLWAHEPQERAVAQEDNALVMVSMLQQVFDWGTAHRVSRARGWSGPAAGKTGTTNDTRDSWFVGFTPEILTVVWVGRDDNTPTALTGASGALPIWVEFMKNIPRKRGEFSWPEHFQLQSRALHSPTTEDINETSTEIWLHIPSERWSP